MHYPLIISSVGDDEEEAQGLAESSLEGHGNGAVFDYYDIGGRFGPTSDGDNDGLISGIRGNSLRYSDNPELFDETINIQISSRNSAILQALHCAQGGVVMPEDGPSRPLNPNRSAADEKKCADIVTADNAKGGAYWDRLMGITTCAEILEFTEQHHITYDGGQLVIYRMEIALRHIQGDLLSSSGYFDAEDYTTKRAAVDQRKGENPRNQWITVFDLHN